MNTLIQSTMSDINDYTTYLNKKQVTEQISWARVVMAKKTGPVPPRRNLTPNGLAGRDRAI